MKMYYFLLVFLGVLCTFGHVCGAIAAKNDDVVCAQVTRSSIKNYVFDYIQKTRPIQWVAWVLNRHEKESTSDARIIMVRNDMPSFIQADPENLECIDPRIIVANQTTLPDNKFKPILIHKDAVVCPFRLRKTKTPLSVSGQWVIHPSRKSADLSSIITEALDQIVNNKLHFDGFCVTHWVPCINYSINDPVIDPFFNQ